VKYQGLLLCHYIQNGFLESPANFFLTSNQETHISNYKLADSTGVNHQPKLIFIIHISVLPLVTGKITERREDRMDIGKPITQWCNNYLS
jgi:hypothetical protein